MKTLSIKALVSLLEAWDADQVVDLFNTYCETDNRMEDLIYYNAEWLELDEEESEEEE